MAKVKLPKAVKRSPKKARKTYKKTVKAAEEVHGDRERAHRTAIGALERSFERVGDHWEKKTSPGPSVDVDGHTKDELYERARELDVRGRSTMTKQELVDAIAGQQG